MSDLPEELDLKFLPDWLKAAPSTNRYADYEGESERPHRDDRRGGKSFGGGKPQGDRRGPRPAGGGRPGGGGPRDGRGPRDFKGGQDRRGPKPSFERRDDRAPRPQFEPRKTVVHVQILPEPAAGAGIAKQIKASARACGVFRVAKMFLDRPERYRVRVTAIDENAMLYQVGDGPVSFDRPAVEAGAFRANFDRLYDVEITQGEPPKGNYTAVARHRFSGVLLGPPNHHGYQVATRKLYEERFSRRMDFADFQREIEMVSDPAAIEQWKEQSGKVTTYKTKPVEGQEQQSFNSLYDVEQHFRATHLPSLVKFAHCLEVAGQAATVGLDRNIAHSIRELIENERHVPIGLVNALRPYFSDAGLHLFKWKRKVLLASAIRPQRHPADQALSDGMSAILTLVDEKPGIKRPDLAKQILGELPPDAPESVEARQKLASDLHYLIHLGYVVEMQNGSLELPPSKKEQDQKRETDGSKAGPTAADPRRSAAAARVDHLCDPQLLHFAASLAAL